MRHEGVTAGRGQAGGEIAWEWIDDGARPEFLVKLSVCLGGLVPAFFLLGWIAAQFGSA